MTKYTPFSVTASVEGDWHRLAFNGSITEEAKPALMNLVTGPKGKVLLDMARVTFINSCGVRDWSFFLKAFRDGRELVFDRVPDDIVRTMNMVSNFHAHLPVRSLFRAYCCDSCNAETMVQFQEGKDYRIGVVPEMPARACGKCGHQAQAIETDEEFFQFLVA